MVANKNTITIKAHLQVWIFLDEDCNIMLERNTKVGDPRGIASSKDFWYLPGYVRTDPLSKEHAALDALWKEQRDRLYAHDCTSFLESLDVQAKGFEHRETYLAHLRLWLQAYYVDHHDDVPLAPTPGSERKFFSLEDAMVHYPVGFQDRTVIAIFMEHMRW